MLCWSVVEKCSQVRLDSFRPACSARKVFWMKVFRSLLSKRHVWIFAFMFRCVLPARRWFPAVIVSSTPEFGSDKRGECAASGPCCTHTLTDVNMSLVFFNTSSRKDVCYIYVSGQAVEIYTPTSLLPVLFKFLNFVLLKFTISRQAVIMMKPILSVSLSGACLLGNPKSPSRCPIMHQGGDCLARQQPERVIQLKTPPPHCPHSRLAL